MPTNDERPPMSSKQSRAIVAEAPAPLISLIYATNCMPMPVMIQFPPAFTPEDRQRAWEALRLIYDEVTDREDNP